MNTDINYKYKTSERYVRNGSDCVMDKVKHILRPATPEEDVRQKTIDYLHQEMGIPYNAMETEVPVTYFKKGQKGRMDIVIYGEKEGARIPIMVVETKAPQIPLLDDVYLQAHRYATQVGISILMITNGSEMDIQKWNNNHREYEQVIKIPTYDELLIPETVAAKRIEDLRYTRRDYKSLFDKNVIREEKEFAYFLGENASYEEAPYFLNLAECFLDTSKEVVSLNFSNYSFVKDGGVRYTSFGNASGGSYPGYYRYFLVEDSEKNTQLVSMAVMGCMNGRTLLIVAVDDFDKHHNSLQLSLGHFANIHEGKMRIFHNGRMTVGNIGPVKSQKVRDYVLSRTNLKMMDKSNFILGELDASEELNCDRSDIKELISNLIEYALLRDELRNETVHQHNKS